MTNTKIDGSMFSQMIIMGANQLANYIKEINALNVFPVPDGDTGTNMNLTMGSGVEEVTMVKSDNISEIAKGFSKGLLMGARGNSGVILSQLFRGFSESVKDKTHIDALALGKALQAGVQTAYKAVMDPVEGTILTVAKDAAQIALSESSSEQNIVTLMEKVVKEAKQSLERTPELLPVLKEVGVVDSGGQGLVYIYEGFLSALNGEPVSKSVRMQHDMETLIEEEHEKVAQDFINTEDITYGYCTEFIVKFESDKLANTPFDEDQFRSELKGYGDSLLVAADDERVKVHLHTELPGEVLNLGQRFGSLIKIDIENMREQHQAIIKQVDHQKAELEKQKYAILTVAMGSGIKETFKSLGATIVIDGGQTMNPSTQDIVEAINRVQAEHIYILPNNKNIILAAEQAATLKGNHVSVIPTKTIPQGMSALFAFNADSDFNENKQVMYEASKDVKTGQVTYAIRDTIVNELTIKENDFIGINDENIQITHQDKIEATKLLLQKLVTEDDELITIFYGEDVTENETKRLEQFLDQTYDDIEYETYQGNQRVYSFIIAVE